MFVEETTLIELRDGQAVVSTKDLFRIIEIPTGRIVGELANGDEVGGEFSEFWDLADASSPYRVAVDYSLLSAIERRGLTVADVVIAPTSGTQCRWCGSSIRRRTKYSCIYDCGTRGRIDRRPLTEYAFDVFWTSHDTTQKCDRLKAERFEAMGPKSALLRSILIEMGVESPNSDWWIFDGRGTNEQFPGLEAFERTARAPVISTGMPASISAAMIA